MSADLRVTAEDAERLIEEALREPVTHLSVECGHGATEGAIAAIARKSRPTIIQLTLIEDLGFDGPRCRHDRDRLLERLPVLQTLHLQADHPIVHGMSHARLDMLDVVVDPICEAVEWNLPALRAIEWDVTRESECDFSIYDHLWRQKLPGLRSLSLRGCHLVFGVPTLDRYEVTDFIASLTHLSVTVQSLVPPNFDREQLTDHLIAHAPALGHLERFAVQGASGLPIDVARVRERVPGFAATR